MSVTHAAYFAAQKHARQRRKGDTGIPYINHPLGVAYILEEAGVTDAEVLQAAILHDTVEDTPTTLAEIEQHFGVRVRSIVAEVSDDKTLPKAKRKRAQMERAATISDAAKLVKMADKIYNCEDLFNSRPPQGWNKYDIQFYFLWNYMIVQKLFAHLPHTDTVITLHNRFDAMTRREFTLVDGETFLLINGTNYEEQLENYYRTLELAI